MRRARQDRPSFSSAQSESWKLASVCPASAAASSHLRAAAECRFSQSGRLPTDTPATTSAHTVMGLAGRQAETGAVGCPAPPAVAVAWRGGCAGACLRACGLRVRGAKVIAFAAAIQLAELEGALHVRLLRRLPHQTRRALLGRSARGQPPQRAGRGAWQAACVIPGPVGLSPRRGAVWSTFKNHSIAPSKDPLRSLTTPMKYCAPTQHGHRGRHSGAALPKQCPDGAQDGMHARRWRDQALLGYKTSGLMGTVRDRAAPWA